MYLYWYVTASQWVVFTLQWSVVAQRTHFPACTAKQSACERCWSLNIFYNFLCIGCAYKTFLIKLWIVDTYLGDIWNHYGQ